MRPCVSVIILWWLWCVAQGSGPFQCGLDICDRRGYVACITTDDSYCLTCTRQRSKCGADEQMTGCHLFCQEQIRQEMLKDFHREQHALNASFADEKQTLMEMVERCKSENEGLQTKLTVTGSVLGVICVGLLLVCIYTICRYKNQKKQTKDPEVAATARETNDGSDETSKLMPYEHSSPCTKGCQTEPLEQEHGEPARPIANGETGHCPAMVELQNIQPTDSYSNANMALR